LLAHPALQLSDARGAQFLASSPPFGSRAAIDVALDVKQHIDPLHCFQGDRRDDGGLAAGFSTRRLGNIR
jgi:hypothetical protein